MDTVNRLGAPTGSIEAAPRPVAARRGLGLARREFLRLSILGAGAALVPAVVGAQSTTPIAGEAGDASPPSGGDVELPLDATVAKRIQAYLDAVVAVSGNPGVALLLVDRGGLTQFFGSGYADLEQGIPWTPGSTIWLASITKVFAGVLAGQLEAEGKIAFDAPVTDYLPWFEVRGDYETPITIEHLLQHTSGLPWEREDIQSSNLYTAYALRETRPFFEAGERFSYSNLGYIVLTLVYEAVEGKPIDQILGERIFDPLGMADSRAITAGSPETDPNAAAYYEPRHYERTITASTPFARYNRQRKEGLDAAISSSTRDLARFATVFLNGGQFDGKSMVPADYFEKMTRGGVLRSSSVRWAYGMDILLDDGDATGQFGQDGGNVGISTDMLIDPALGVAAIAFTNTFLLQDARSMTRFALGALAAERSGEALPGIPVEDLAILTEVVPNAEDYVGRYRSGGGEELQFRANGQSVSLVADEGAYPLSRWWGYGEDGFATDHPDFGLVPLVFQRTTNDDGTVASVAYGPTLYKRCGDETCTVDFDATDETPAAWDAYTGHYWCETCVPPAFTVYARDGKLYKWHAVYNEGESLLTQDEREEGLFLDGDPDEPTGFVEFSDLAGGQAMTAIYNGAPFRRTAVWFTP